MITKFKIEVVGAVAALLAFGSKAFAAIPASTTAALNTGFTELKNDILQVITDNLPAVFIVFAVILGIVLLLKLARRVVGR